MSSNLEIIILAAGKGTRMNSDLPKVLHKICGVTMLEKTIRACRGLKPKKISVVTGYHGDLVSGEVLRFSDVYKDLNLETVIQEPQLGTGHATKVGLSILDKNNTKDTRVLILPSDIPLINGEILSEFVSESQEYDLTFLSCEHPEPATFGRVVRNEEAEVVGIVELKDCTDEQVAISEINSSIYLVDKQFLAVALEELKPNNKQNEYYLTDIVSLAISRKLKVEGLVTDEFQVVSGANDLAELAELEAIRRTEIVYSYLKKGVLFQDPTCVYIDEGVRIEKGAYIGAGVTICGRTEILESAKIEGYCFLNNVKIKKNAYIKQHCYLEDAVIGEKAQVGPFAHLRPGTELEAEVKIGNFVETKNARFSKHSKANHLSYIGDARVGLNTNIGAGTITCNYDGVKKHQTVIGDNCFIGSDSILVAPLTINEEAYIGAGSVITKEVPRASLAIARAKQTVIEDWVAKKKKEGN